MVTPVTGLIELVNTYHEDNLNIIMNTIHHTLKIQSSFTKELAQTLIMHTASYGPSAGYYNYPSSFSQRSSLKPGQDRKCTGSTPKVVNYQRMTTLTHGADSYTKTMPCFREERETSVRSCTSIALVITVGNNFLTGHR